MLDNTLSISKERHVIRNIHAHKICEEQDIGTQRLLQDDTPLQQQARKLFLLLLSQVSTALSPTHITENMDIRGCSSATISAER